ncbi:MAG: 5'/3'-nucleotidase SurE [Armatimonadetes bacterium]|nr:5'/3'-nucleotidase SurE [Armatimonadota bacterium]
MRILVCNDDGIRAPGLRALVVALAEVGEVVVAAPERERSAVSHAITMHKPLRAHRTEVAGATAWAISGTPSDCILLAIRELLDAPPDVVAAGINRGANLGEDAWYSGTVAAAVEAALLGVPGIAFSVTAFQDLDWTAAADYARHLTPRVAAQADRELVLNVNVPNLPPDRIAGWELCTQGRRGYATDFDRRRDPRGGDYYWLGTGSPRDEPVPGTDLAAIAAGRIAVTPLSVDLSAPCDPAAIRAWMDGLNG